MTTIREHLKFRFPGMWKRAYQKHHRSEAVRLFCMECMGGQVDEVELCTDKGCPLYQYRLTRHRERLSSTPQHEQEAPESTKISSEGKDTPDT